MKGNPFKGKGTRVLKGLLSVIDYGKRIGKNGALEN